MSLEDLALKVEEFGFGFSELSYNLLSEIKPEGITPLQFKILQYLLKGELITLSQISYCLGVSLPNTSREVKKLLEKRLIAKRSDLKDKRVSFITLSQNGADLMNVAFDKLKGNICKRYETLENEEINEVVKALDLLCKKLLNA